MLNLVLQSLGPLLFILSHTLFLRNLLRRIIVNLYSVYNSTCVFNLLFELFGLEVGHHLFSNCFLTEYSSSSRLLIIVTLKPCFIVSHFVVNLMLHVFEVLVTRSVDFNVLLFVIIFFYFIDVALGHCTPRRRFETDSR